MSIKGIIMLLEMNNKRLDRKILIILDFEMGFYLPIYHCAVKTRLKDFSLIKSDVKNVKNQDS